jgi:dTDP-4-amino-4,6-dideoxygalactose transaminase
MNLGGKVVEDCTQSHGATRGLTGSVGAYSLYPTKNLDGIGDVGMVVTDDEINEMCRALEESSQ